MLSSCIHFEPSAGMMIAYTLKERVCFQINNLSSVLLITYLQLFCWLRLQPRWQVMWANQWTFLAGIPVAVEALEAVTMQADRVFSFRIGNIASRLYGAITGILGDTSLATKDDSCCEFYTSCTQIPGVRSLLQLTLYDCAFYLMVISMELASRHHSGIQNFEWLLHFLKNLCTPDLHPVYTNIQQEIRSWICHKYATWEFQPSWRRRKYICTYDFTIWQQLIYTFVSVDIIGGTFQM